jgi:hypothetical protein
MIMVWSGIRPVLKGDSIKSIDAQLEITSTILSFTVK